jgi:hypothetical protein
MGVIGLTISPFLMMTKQKKLCMDYERVENNSSLIHAKINIIGYAMNVNKTECTFFIKTNPFTTLNTSPPFCHTSKRVNNNSFFSPFLLYIKEG